MTVIQDFIRSGLRTRDWTQAQLAREIDSAPAQVSRWLSEENPARPSTEACKSLARVFEVEESEVLRLAGHLSPHARAWVPDTVDQLTIDGQERLTVQALLAELRAIPRRSWEDIITVVHTFRTVAGNSVDTAEGASDPREPGPPPGTVVAA